MTPRCRVCLGALLGSLAALSWPTMSSSAPAAEAKLGPPPPLSSAPPVVVKGPGFASSWVSPAGPDAKAWDAGYQLAWAVQLNEGNRVHAMAIAPSGDVVVATNDWVGVLARHSGAVLESGSGCVGMTYALAAVGHQSLLAVCWEEVLELTMPGLASRKLMTVDAVDAVALRPPVLVTAVDDEVHLFDMTTAQPTGELNEQGEVKDVLLSADRKKLALFVAGQGIILHDLATRERRWIAAGSPLDFAPRSDGLLVDLGRPRIYDVSGGFARVDLVEHVDLSLRESRFVDGDLLVANSLRAGVVFVQLSTMKVAAPAYVEGARPPDAGFVVSADAKQVCAYGHFGELACYAKRKLPPSSYRARAKPAANHSTTKVSAP